MMRASIKPARPVTPRPAAITLADSALQFLQVLWRVEHALERTSKRMEDKLGISGPQRFALRVIGAFPRVGPGDLAMTLHLHPSTVTGILRRLEEKGLIRRVAHAEDGRRAHLTLTKKGLFLNQPAVTGTVERAVRVTLAAFNERDRQAAAAVLDRLSAALMRT